MNKFLRTFIISLLLFFLPIYLMSQITTEGDTTLCSARAGQVELTLTAELGNSNQNFIDAEIYTDDIFGGVVNIGFDFTFYGNTYNQVVLGSNNYLSFNLENANGYCDWTIGDTIPTTLETETLNAILCPWQDIYPGVNGNGAVQYATTGEAPNRVFIVSFCGIPMFSCTDICYTSQIKLFESTNVIETHIAQKVLCESWNSGHAIHGLHNEDGTIAHVVTGLDGIVRNYPNQWATENDGWSFTPNGNNDYIIENIVFAPAVVGTDIIWQDNNGTIVGGGPTITVTPVETTTYTAGTSICGPPGDWCGFEGGIISDDVIINFDEGSDCAGGCLEGYTLLTLDYNSNGLSYFTVISLDGSYSYISPELEGEGSIQGCFLTELGNECLFIDIEGELTSWSLSWQGEAGNLQILNQDTLESNYIGDGCEAGCTNLEACNYNENANTDDGSCILVTVENNIQCDECCVFSSGNWLNEHMAGMDGMNPTLSGSGVNWELTSAAWMETIETDGGDGTIISRAVYGADESNLSTLTSPCYTGVVSITTVYTLDSEGAIVGDIEFYIYDDSDFSFYSTGAITGLDMENFTLTGSLLGGNSGTLITIDTDGDGIGDCDESIDLKEEGLQHKKLIKVVDALGRQIDQKNKGALLLYIYDDGSVNTKMRLK